MREAGRGFYDAVSGLGTTNFANKKQLGTRKEEQQTSSGSNVSGIVFHVVFCNHSFSAALSLSALSIAVGRFCALAVHALPPTGGGGAPVGCGR